MAGTQSVTPLTFARITRLNLIRHPVRTVLTALGVSVGVIAVVSMSAISNGFQSMVDLTLHWGDSDLMVFQANQAADILSTLDEAETRRRLLQLDSVAAVAGTLWSVQRIDDHPFIFTVGLRRDEFAMGSFELIEGAAPQDSDQLLVGRIAARALKRAVGDQVTVGGRSMTVCGIYNTGMILFDGGVVLDLERLQEIASRSGQITAANIKLAEGFTAEDAVEAIERAHPDLVAIAAAEEYSKVDQGLRILQATVSVVSLIALLVGGLVVLNTMWMSVFERTREIGILRALGWSRRSIIGMVLVESLMLGVLAAVIGAGLGVGLAELSTVARFTEQFVDPVYDAATFLRAAAVALGIGAVGGLIPSWRAATFSPVEALRYE